MTEEQYIAKLPMLATWSPEARAQFVEGMNELNGMAITGQRDEVMDAVGVLVLGPGGPWAHYVDRTTVLVGAASESEFPRAALAALRKHPPGVLQVLIIGGDMRMLLEIPGQIIQVAKPGSEEN